MMRACKSVIDKAGEPVAPAWLWLDARAAAITEGFAQSADYPAHYQRTGTGTRVLNLGSVAKWLQGYSATRFSPMRTG